MGDLLGSPRVAPLLRFCFPFFLPLGGATKADIFEPCTLHLSFFHLISGAAGPVRPVGPARSPRGPRGRILNDRSRGGCGRELLKFAKTVRFRVCGRGGTFPSGRCSPREVARSVILAEKISYRPEGPDHARRQCNRDSYKAKLSIHVYGCDHTSTKAPDPIRTPQLSVLGRE